MTLRGRLVDWGLAALLLVVPALILRSSLKAPEETNKLDQAILRVSSPLQAAVSWVVDGVGGAWSRYIDLVGVEKENRELRSENERLRKELATATRRAIDIEELEKLLKLQAATPADTIAARVIAASTSPHYRVMRIRIDRGVPDRVVERMPVITSDGLVGRVLRVYGAQADVMLVTDKDSHVPVRIKRNGLSGTMSGLGSPDSYDCKFEWQKPSDMPGAEPSLVEGDIVQTAGSNDFPPGIVVGVVSEVHEQDYGMDQEAVVKPTVSFSNLSAVAVITAQAPPPDPDADTKKKPESDFDVRPF
jgi:rod shape-determining protein MreC